MEPITREEMYLAAAAGYDITPPEPITRKEFFLAKLAGMDVPTPATFSREEMFLDAVAQRSPAAVIEALNVTKNGVYTAGNGVDGYSPVTVDIPDPVLQDKTITENGTYTKDEGFDGLGSVTVNVEASSSESTLKYFETTVKLTSTLKSRVDVDFGFTPDFIILFPNANTAHKSKEILAVACSTKWASTFGVTTPYLGLFSDGTQVVYRYSSQKMDSTTQQMYLYGVDATGFNLGFNYSWTAANYKVIAIGL